MIYLCSPAIEQHLKANGFQKTIYLELTARRTFSPNARKQKNPPANPISGSELPVLGNCDGAGAGSDGAGASAGATTAVSDVVSAVSVRGAVAKAAAQAPTMSATAGVPHDSSSQTEKPPQSVTALWCFNGHNDIEQNCTDYCLPSWQHFELCDYNCAYSMSAQ